MEILITSEVAKILRCHSYHVRRLADKYKRQMGAFRFEKRGHYKFFKSEFEAWLKGLDTQEMKVDFRSKKVVNG